MDSAGGGLQAMLEPWRGSHALACDVVSGVAEHGMLAASVEFLLATEPEYIPTISPYLEVLQRVYQGRGGSLDDAIEALLEYTVEYMRHQVSFLSSGEYSNTDFEEVFAKVYDNAELMIGTYLPGLYMTQLFWPIHYRVLEVYRKQFLSRLREPAQLIEVGVGHGLTLLSGLQRHVGARTLALDVSRHAIAFSKGLIAAAGVADERCDFRLIDITRERIPGVSADGATMGEILEHVSEPTLALKHLRAMLREDALAFITTVIDSNAVDHIYQFESLAEIDSMIAAAGFVLERSELLRPADMRLGEPAGSDPTQFYYGIARAV